MSQVLVEGGYMVALGFFAAHSCFSASGFTTRSDIGPAREGPSAETIACVTSSLPSCTTLDRFHREAQAKRGEEPDIDSEQFQDPDNEYGLFNGMTYEADDEEADKIYDTVDRSMDSRRRARRCVLSG